MPPRQTHCRLRFDRLNAVAGTDQTRIGKVRFAHVAAVQRKPGHQQAIAGSEGCFGRSKCQLRRKLTLSCAVQQGGVDLLSPVRGRPVQVSNNCGHNQPHSLQLRSTNACALLAKWNSYEEPLIGAALPQVKPRMIREE